MKKTFFCVFFLIFLTLITCTVLSVKIEEEMTLEVIGYEKRESYDAFIPPKDMLFTDEEGSHLYEVYQGTGWESGLRAREISLYGGSFNVDRNYIVARGASRQPVYGERADLYDGKDTGPSTYVAYYPEGIPEENQYLSQAVILEQSDHVLLLYQENGIFPFTENRAKGGMVQLEGPGWRVYSLDALEQLMNHVPHAMIAIALVFAVAILGILTCILMCTGGRNKWLIMTNFVLIAFALIALGQVLKLIDFPASMLPSENIFNISHYQTELAEIYSALEQLGSNTTKTYVELRDYALQKGYGILKFGGISIVMFSIMELSLSLYLARKKPRYQGKYLSSNDRKRT